MTAADASGAHLEWSVLARFGDYVQSMSDGRIHLEDGATRLETGAFSFPLLDTDEADGHTIRSFGGTVRFVGHGGMLNLPLGAVQVRLGPGGNCQISIADPDDSHVRLLFATALAERDGDAVTLTTALAEDGSELFFYRYPQGFALDPARLVGSPLQGVDAAP